MRIPDERLFKLKEYAMKPGLGCSFDEKICSVCFSIVLERAYFAGYDQGQKDLSKKYELIFEKKECLDNDRP